MYGYKNASVCVPYAVKHSPQAKNTKLVSWFAKVQYHCPRQYQKVPKIKNQNQKVKSRWLNSRPAVDFTNSTQSILVSKSTSSSKKSKIQKENPLHSGNGSRRFRSIQQHCYNPFLNSQIHHKNHQS